MTDEKKKIEKLTPEQEAKFPEYVQKWTSIGLSTKKEGDREKANTIIDKVYEYADLVPPKHKIWVDNPLHGAFLAHFVEEFQEFVVANQNDIPACIAHIKSKKSQEELDRVRGDLASPCFGCHDANWLGFYDFFLTELKVEGVEKLRGLIEISNYVGWFWPFTEVVILSDKPEQIHVKDNQLHCIDGPAVKYGPEFEIFALNGVRVPKELVMTPADKLDAHLILTETNAEVRREIVRKIGTTRMITDLGGKVIDKMDDYELVTLDLGDGRRRPYLKMLNPSLGTIHVEGVSPECETVKAALAFRNGMTEYEKPVVLT